MHLSGTVANWYSVPGKRSIGIATVAGQARREAIAGRVTKHAVCQASQSRSLPLVPRGVDDNAPGRARRVLHLVQEGFEDREADEQVTDPRPADLRRQPSIG